MKRADKVTLIENMNREFQEIPHIILTTFSGLTVNQDIELRAKIREIGGGYRVIKNRLAKRAAAGTAVEPLIDKFEGPCALATHANDPVLLAKTLSEFAKDNPQVEMRAGLLEAKDVLEADGVVHLASLPGLQELRAQLASLILQPATSLVRLLTTPGAQIARVLQARTDEQES